MKDAAQTAGYSAIDIAREMSVGEAKVYRWWRGERPPEEDELERYAQVVGRALGWFLEGEAPPMTPDDVTNTLTGIIHLVMSDEDLPTALREMGYDVEEGEERILAAGTEKMRSVVSEIARKDWDLLTPTQRRAVVQLVQELAGERRPRPA